jgi:hypothetical protein
MNKFNLILVLSKVTQSNLVEDLFEMGFIPLVKPDINNVIHEIRHQHFILLIYHGDDLDIEPLEFVISVREMDGIIPIIILGSDVSKKEKELLMREPNVFLVKNYYQDFRKILKQIPH